MQPLCASPRVLLSRFVARRFRLGLTLTLASVALGAVALRAQTAPTTPESATMRAASDFMLRQGFDPVRLKRIDALFESYVQREQIAGAISYVARDGHVVHQQSYGFSDRENQKPMSPDAIFRIASMSKAVTTVAVMMLYEEGRFLLNDPIEKYIPAFKGSVVAVKSADPSVPYVTEPVKKPITIRHLLTHTAGLTYGDGLALAEYQKANLHRWYFANHDETIGEAVDRLAKLPLHGQPGDSWQYGFSTDVLGRLVEVISGQPLDRFFEERIFKPLKMTDACFFLPPEKAARLAPVYGIVDGKLVLRENSAKTDYIQGPRKCFSGGAGLLCTVNDYARFLQMLLNDGELDGVRLLSPATVRLMHTNHTANLYRRDTAGFGLGFWVNDDPGHFGELAGPGSYGWGSAYYPVYFVDPKEKLVAFFMTQLTPAPGVDFRDRFKVVVYQALVK